jgi:hypothetical protein
VSAEQLALTPRVRGAPITGAGLLFVASHEWQVEPVAIEDAARESLTVITARRSAMKWPSPAGIKPKPRTATRAVQVQVDRLAAS